MTANEVFRALFWIVAAGYVLYVGWSIYRLIAAHGNKELKRSPSIRR